MANQYDIHIQLIPVAKYLGEKFFSFGFKRSIGIRGLQKLINMFAKYLITPVGTDPMDLQYGTELPGLLGSNVDLIDAQDILILSVDKTVQYIQTVQRSKEIPIDERLSSATVTKYIAMPSVPGFAAQIFIRNIAGQGLNLILPTLEVR